MQGKSRRDERAEPDDGSAPPRIDVVDVEGASGRETASAAIVTLRRELARLTQQASAVEHALEDQRREREDAVARLFRATERNADLEAAIIGLESECRALERTHEATLEELHKLRAERDDLERAIEAAKSASSELGRVRAEAARAREDADAYAQRIATLEGDLVESERERADARADAEALRATVAKLRDESVRDRKIARDHIDAIEQAKAQLEQDLVDLRRDLEGRIAELEVDVAAARRERAAALETAAAAERRATEERIARAALEQAVVKLRDDVVAAFGKVGAAAPVASVAALDPSPPPPPRMPSSAPLGLVDRGWSVAPEPEPEQLSPVSRSVPPPRPSSPRMGSMRPSAPPELLATIHTAGTKPPPPLEVTEMIDERPAGGVETRPLPAPQGTHPPETRRESSPPAHAAEREALFAMLSDREAAHEAAATLREHPEWLRGAPPAALVAALGTVDYDVDAPVFELARAWEREPLCRALLASIREEADDRLREHGAWLLKHLAAPSEWKALAELALKEDEPAGVRRWVLEALARVASTGAIGWQEIGDALTALAKHPDANLRDGVVGILSSLDRSEDKQRLLLEILRSDTDEVVIASAVHALSSVLPIELDPAVIERLLDHPSPRVERSVRDLVDRAKQK